LSTIIYKNFSEGFGRYWCYNIERRGAVDKDCELMLKVKETGDIDSFEEIFKRYKARVIGIAYRFLQDLSDAEDVAQEVFLRVYRSRRHYKPRARFSTWLYRIVHNLCLNKIRDKGRLSTTPFNNPIQIPIGVVGNGLHGEKDDTTDAHLEKREGVSIIKRAISSLPPAQRTAVILRRYEGMSYREISEVLGCSRSAVDSLLQRARQNLKRRLSQYFEK
jgi:RNA polymerase sigma-70 factor (ECF subfamily)